MVIFHFLQSRGGGLEPTKPSLCLTVVVVYRLEIDNLLRCFIIGEAVHRLGAFLISLIVRSMMLVV